MVRTQLEALVSDKSGGRRTLRKDLDAAVLQQIEAFHRQSFYWPCLLNLSGQSLSSYSCQSTAAGRACQPLLSLLLLPDPQPVVLPAQPLLSPFTNSQLLALPANLSYLFYSYPPHSRWLYQLNLSGQSHSYSFYNQPTTAILSGLSRLLLFTPTRSRWPCMLVLFGLSLLL
jgi:hypothetical protein